MKSIAPRLKLMIFIAISILLVITAYVWFISFGYWTTWDTSTYFYDELASAFSHRSLALEKQVNPELLSLTDPYDPKQRAGIDFPLDISLYHGKYYLYFGPAPALLLIPLKWIGLANVGDHILVFIFISGMLIFQSLIILELWKHFFQEVPSWLICLCVIYCGLISPSAWMLTEARIYEAAVTAGQFFFLAGLYFNITALTRESTPTKRLMIGGTLWTFTLGSRITQIIPVGFMTLVIVLFYLRTNYQTKSISKILYPIISLCLPMIIGVALLASYNWARFHSIFETGFHYQLTTHDLHEHSDVLFSPLYILPNSYEYLAAPPKVISEFPYLQPVRSKGSLLFSFIHLPKIYYTRATTGILYSSPFIIFCGLAFVSIIIKRFQKKESASNSQLDLPSWITFGLLGSSLLSFATIVSFFWVVTRYSAEFSPTLALLSIIGFWRGYLYLSNRPIIKNTYILIGVALILTSIVSSNLLVFGIRSETYQSWNPVLWGQLKDLFSF